MAGVDKAPPQRDALINFSQLAADLDTNCLSVDLLSTKSVKPGPSPELICEEKMPSDESDEVSSRQVESNLDMASDGMSSDSDYCGEGDEDVSLRNKCSFFN